MAILDLPESILASLSNVLTQLQHVLPQPKQPTDFSAIAFKWENQELIAIQQPKKMYLEDLKGIERQKDRIIQNTLQFLNGLPANDVLLTGSRGTGKSSIVRALLTEYSDQGLRLIEIERDDLSDLPKIQKLIEQRPEKFIVYCDDLAFNAEDENYRSLKSVLDGSLQSGSSNFIFMRRVIVVTFYLNLCMKIPPYEKWTYLNTRNYIHKKRLKKKYLFQIVLECGFHSTQWTSNYICKSLNITLLKQAWNITILFEAKA